MASSTTKSKKTTAKAAKKVKKEILEQVSGNDAEALAAEASPVAEPAAELESVPVAESVAEAEAAPVKVVRRRRKNAADEAVEPGVVRRSRRRSTTGEDAENAAAEAPARPRRRSITEAKPQTKQEKDNARRTALESRISGVSKNDTMKVYMGEIGQIDLVSKNEEAELAEAIHCGSGELHDEARATLIKANLRLVVKIAHDFKGLGLPLLVCSAY